ncbi:MAG: hypothetical protein WC263_04095, partial [Candidatus Micrarchaeia archaeon]
MAGRKCRAKGVALFSGSPGNLLRPAGAAFSGRKPNGIALLLAVFSLLALAHLAFPEQNTGRGQVFNSYVVEQQAAFQNRVDGWWAIAITAILICISFNTLVYMLGAALESQEVKNYAKAEFMQVSASSLMIFFAVALIFTVSSGGSQITVAAFDFMGDLLGTGDSSISCAAATESVPAGRFTLWKGDPQFGRGPIGAFKCKLQEKISAVDNAYENVKVANMPVEERLSVCYYLLGVPVWCGAWDLPTHQRVEQAHLLAAKMTDISVSLNAQYVLAEYVQKNMLSVFLPFGLVLRIFPLTRGVGGLFVALGVGFYFVWPTFFMLTDPSFIKVNAPPDQPRQEGICFTGFRGSSVLLSGIVTAGGAGQQSDIAIAQGLDLVYVMTIGTVFYPFVALVLTL